MTRRAALPLVLIGALVLKNLILFGLPGTTSWGGNNLNRVAAAGVDPAELEELAAMGVTTPLTLGLQFPQGDIIVDALDLEPQVTGIPALDRTTKTPLNEYTTINPLNYNHWAYTAAATTYARDAWVLIRRYPRAYLATVRANVRTFHRAVTLDSFVRANRSSVARLAQVSERVEAGVNLVVGLAVLFGAVSMLCRDLPKRERLLLAYLVGTVVWTTLLGVTFEVGENNRFRYHLTGLHLLLIAYLLSKSAGYVESAWRSRGAVSLGRGPQDPDSKSEVMGAGWG